MSEENDKSVDDINNIGMEEIQRELMLQAKLSKEESDKEFTQQQRNTLTLEKEQQKLDNLDRMEA